MILFANSYKKYALNARLSEARLETDTVDFAKWELIDLYGNVILTKTLTSGLSIEHSDAMGDGYIFVEILDTDLNYSGEYTQRLSVTNCSGQTSRVAIRGEKIEVLK